MIGLARSWSEVGLAPSVSGADTPLPKPKVAGSTPVVRFTLSHTVARDSPACGAFPGEAAEGLHSLAQRRTGAVGSILARGGLAGRRRKLEHDREVESLTPKASLIQARKAHLLNHLEVFADTVCTPSQEDSMSDAPPMTYEFGAKATAYCRACGEAVRSDSVDAVLRWGNAHRCTPSAAHVVAADTAGPSRLRMEAARRDPDPDLNRPDYEDDPDEEDA